MTLSYTEEIVSEYFKHLTTKDGKPKYIVSEHIYYQEKGSSKKVKGWHDIDVLAIGKEEICIIQTKSYAFFMQTKKDSIGETVKFFKDAERVVRKRYDVSNKKIRKIFIAHYGLSKSFKKELSKKNIESRDLEDIIQDFLRILKKQIKGYLIGKEDNIMTRTLIALIEGKFIKDKLFEN